MRRAMALQASTTLAVIGDEVQLGAWSGNGSSWSSLMDARSREIVVTTVGVLEPRPQERDEAVRHEVA